MITKSFRHAGVTTVLVTAINLAAGELPLNGSWLLAVEPNAAAADARFAQAHQPGFAAEGFKPVPVPGVWSLHGFEEPRYDRPTPAEGFYRYEFAVPESMAKERVLLHFGGVWQSAEVWLNGHHCGRNDSGFTAFSFDVSRYLEPGRKNTLAVRVRQMSREYLFDCNDDWVFPGIYRDVWLETQPRELAIDRIEVTTDFDKDFADAVLRARVFLLRWPAGETPFTLRAVLRDQAGHEVGHTQTTGRMPGAIFSGSSGREVVLTLAVRAPRAWTAETPDLYDLTVEVLAGDQVVHSRSEKVGFREISWEGGVFRLNGRPIKLRGVARHDEHPAVGRATRPEHWRQDIALMKAANINAVRTAHYPPAEGFLRLCDELGLYVVDEIPFGKGDNLLHDPAYAGAALARARATIARDRNRPSIIAWSIGNEDPLTGAHLEVVRAVKGWDSTRPTLLPYHYDANLPPEVDLMAPHYLTAPKYAALLSSSQRPVLSTEYNHALGADDFGGLAARWEVLRDSPQGAGGMIWNWADQSVKRPVLGRPVLDPLGDLGRYVDASSDLIRHSDAGEGWIWDAHGVSGSDGIVNPDRSPQRDYWETKAVYAPVRILDSVLPLSTGADPWILRVHNEHDFISLTGFVLQWTLMADEIAIASGEAALSAPARQTEHVTIVRPDSRPPAGTDAWLSLVILRPDRSTLTMTSVRLGRATLPAMPAPNVAPLRVDEMGDGFSVHTPGRKFVFARREGLLTVSDDSGRELIRGISPTIWRPLTITEMHYYRKYVDRDRLAQPADLGVFQTEVTRWEYAASTDTVRLLATTRHVVDSRNSFSVDWEFLVTSDGTLKLDYRLAPAVVIPWLPHAGMELAVAPDQSRLRWAGPGPLAATVNKQAAVHFGVWDLVTPTGPRLVSDWAELGSVTRVVGATAVEWSASRSAWRLHRSLNGHFTKSIGPDFPHEWVDSGQAWTGSLVLSPIPLGEHSAGGVPRH